MVDCLNFAVTDPPAAVGSATTFTDASRVLGAFREFSARSPIKVLELSVFFVVHPIRPNARRVMRLIRLIAVCCLLFAVCCLHRFYFHCDFSNQFISKESFLFSFDSMHLFMADPFLLSSISV